MVYNLINTIHLPVTDTYPLSIWTLLKHDIIFYPIWITTDNLHCIYAHLLPILKLINV